MLVIWAHFYYYIILMDVVAFYLVDVYLLLWPSRKNNLINQCMSQRPCIDKIDKILYSLVAQWISFLYCVVPVSVPLSFVTLAAVNCECVSPLILISPGAKKQSPGISNSPKPNTRQPMGKLSPLEYYHLL